jgi:RNA polymerase sigma factor (sigma-70 family)
LAEAEVEEKKDAELVTLARMGDLDAFGDLLDRYQTVMKSVAIRMLDDDEIAVEMVQEALLQAFLSIHNLNDPERFKSWLYGIVLNVCRNYLRRELGKGFNVEALTENLHSNATTRGANFEDPQVILEKLEYRNQFFSLIDKLKPIYKEVILLYYFRHFRLAEIAEAQAVSLETVKVRLHRARDMLRHQLRLLYPEMDQVIRWEDRRITMLEVKVVDVLRLSKEEGCIVLLKDQPGKHLLLIWIGTFEGFSIAASLENLQTPRPLTYRWIDSILDVLGAELEEVRIEGLKEDTFLGTMVIRKGDSLVELDARPSDLIALAAQKGAPVYVGEEIMMKSGIDLSSVRGELKPLQGVQEMISEFSRNTQKFQEARSSEVERQKKRAELIERVFGPQ